MTTVENTAPKQEAGRIEYAMTCSRCKGTGKITHDLPAGWEEVRDRLVEAGQRNKKFFQNYTVEGRIGLEQARADIQAAEEIAAKIGVKQEICARWAGLEKAAYNTLVHGRNRTSKTQARGGRDRYKSFEPVDTLTMDCPDCRGKGQKVTPLNRRQNQLVEKLKQLGKTRTYGGNEDEVPVILRGVELSVPQEVMAHALGMGRANLAVILRKAREGR